MAEVPVKDKIEYTVALVSDFAKKYSLSTTYNSELYKKLCDPKTGLYFQSPLYVYDYLKPKSKQENYNECKLQKTLENPNRPRHEQK